MGAEIKLDDTSIQSDAIVKPVSKAVKDPTQSIKKAIWWYFWLLIFEGALRKWFLPGLSTPLLIVRDPIAFWIVFAAWSRSIIPRNIFLFGMVSLGAFGFVTALIIGHGNLPVAVYGARIFLFHFPMIFIIGRVFTRDDVIELGKKLLWLSIPMAILIGLQFYSPQSAWVNRGLGDDTAGAGFSGALGYYRPPGTFSFTTGNTLFFGLVGAYLIYFLFKPNGVNKIVLIGSAVSVIAAVPLSISRTLAFELVISLVFAFVVILRRPKNIGKALGAFMIVAVLLFGLSTSSFFKTATQVLNARFTNAETSEGGLQGTLVDRYLGGMLSALSNSGKLPFFGVGIGMGTKVGSQLLSGNRRSWLVVEDEWGRIIGEMGPLMGLSVVLLRVLFSFKLGSYSYRKMARGDLLPWLLLSFSLFLVAQGNWAQPTSLGFSIIGAGLVMAAIRTNELGAHVVAVSSKKARALKNAS